MTELIFQVSNSNQTCFIDNFRVISAFRMSKSIDDKKLFEALNKAIEDDKLYWIRNDAKIRASYTSKNYDEFRETVAAAHIKPLQNTDKSKSKNVWNCKTYNYDDNE